MRSLNIILPALVLFAGHAVGQTATNTAPSATTAAPSVTENELTKAWSYSASVFTYLVPDDRDYAQPTITADHDWLHLEARYNYEAVDTGSVWVGYNWSGGNKLAWEFTPMLGGVFGDVTGIAPGYEGSLSWSKLELYSEGEYVFDTGDSSGNFFYSWSELSLAPVDWLRFGVVVQRTKAYQTDVEIQRGFLAGVTCKKVAFTAYLFNPDQSKPTVVLAVDVTF